VTVGFVRLGRAELEQARKDKERLDIRVVGRFELDDEVTPELADSAIERLSVRGSLRVAQPVLDRLGDKVAKGGRRP
jgi:hypothetical protein